jgi:hypothetical protein
MIGHWLGLELAFNIFIVVIWQRRKKTIPSCESSATWLQKKIDSLEENETKLSCVNPNWSQQITQILNECIVKRNAHGQKHRQELLLPMNLCTRCSLCSEGQDRRLLCCMHVMVGLSGFGSGKLTIVAWRETRFCSMFLHLRLFIHAYASAGKLLHLCCIYVLKLIVWFVEHVGGWVGLHCLRNMSFRSVVNELADVNQRVDFGLTYHRSL